jgi:hypothetical protein
MEEILPDGIYKSLLIIPLCILILVYPVPFVLYQALLYRDSRVAPGRLRVAHNNKAPP